MSELSAALDAAISGVEAGLPQGPLHDSGDGEWDLFELDPETAGDYPQKDDLVMAVTRVPELLEMLPGGLARVVAALLASRAVLLLEVREQRPPRVATRGALKPSNARWTAI